MEAFKSDPGMIGEGGALMPLKRVARAVRGEPDRQVDGEPIRGVSIDTRTLQAGDLFVALPGASQDGHAYVDEAFKRGASAAIVQEPVPARGVTIRVPDTREALWKLAQVHRRSMTGQVAAITGSNGKTTTKEMIAHILGARAVSARKSFNNDIGVPLTILSAPRDIPFLVLEVGTSAPGEIARLSRLAHPDVAVITSVGPAHLKGFGSVDAVATEKVSILTSLGRWGLGVIPEDARLMWRVSVPAEQLFTFGFRPRADIHPTEVGPGMRFVVRGEEFRLDVAGRWNMMNALAATAVCLAWDVPLRECAERLRTFRGPRMRMERVDCGGVTVINDAYNSNPASASLAVREFARMEGGRRRIAVMGEMLELGEASEEAHAELGQLIAGSGIDLVIGIGPLCEPLIREVRDGLAWHFADIEEAKAEIGRIVRDGDLVLLKGSRATALERLLPYLKLRGLRC